MQQNSKTTGPVFLGPVEGTQPLDSLRVVKIDNLLSVLDSRLNYLQNHIETLESAISRLDTNTFCQVESEPMKVNPKEYFGTVRRLDDQTALFCSLNERLDYAIKTLEQYI